MGKFIGKTVQFILESGKQARLMVMECIYQKKDLFTRDSSETTGQKGKENILQETSTMKATLRTINSMEKEQRKAICISSMEISNKAKRSMAD